MAATKTYDLLIRVSKMNERDEDDASTMTIRQQVTSSAGAIAAKGGRVGKELRAIDQSGFTVTESPAWREALDRVRRGESAGFAIAYDDRLGRNWRKAGPFFDAAEAIGAEIIFSNLPGVDYRSDDGRTLTGILAVVAERGYLTARNRGNAIAAETLARGVPNSVPYGYARNGTYVDGRLTRVEDAGRDPKALVPDPATAPIVEAIFKMRARRPDRMSWAAIAAALAPEPTPAGKPRWTHGTLWSVVHNRAYLGEVRLGDREPIVGAHQPLVAEATWKAAQSGRRGWSASGKFRKGLASDLVTCSSCGRGMGVVGGKSADVSYGCRNDRASLACERPVFIRKNVVDAWLEEWVLDGIENGVFDMFVTARELGALAQAHREAVERRKRNVKATRDWDPEDREAGYRADKADEDIAKAAYDDALSRAADAADLPADADAWHLLPLDAQRRIVGGLVERIVVAPPISRARAVPTTALRLTLVATGGSA